MFAKISILVALVALVASVHAVDARPKRSVIVAAAPAVAVASVPVVHTVPVASAVVHHQPTSVVSLNGAN